MRILLKLIFILILAAAIFGAAAYYANELYFKPERLLREEKLKPPPPPPPDPTLPELTKCLELKKQGKWADARTSLEAFLDNYPESTKLDDAREALGEVNTHLIFTPGPSPEKVLYVVRPGDVLTKVAAKTRSSVELIMKANKLTAVMLRIDQKLWVPQTNFTVQIHRKTEKVVLLNNNKFFKQYSIKAWPASYKKGGPPQPKVVGKVTDKIAWLDGQRVMFTDKGYENASHWIQSSIPGYTLCGVPTPGDTKVQKPPGGGVELAPESLPELAALLRKTDSVTLE